MMNNRSVRYEALSILISLLVVIITASQVIGERIRLVHAITIIAGSIAVGIAAGRLIEKIRNSGRRTKSNEAS